MQTKFKWTEKQRLLIISMIALGVEVVPELNAAHSLGNKIKNISTESADFLNNNQDMQLYLRRVFELLQTTGRNKIYDQMMLLEKENKQISFAA